MMRDEDVRPHRMRGAHLLGCGIERHAHEAHLVGGVADGKADMVPCFRLLAREGIE